MKHSLFWRLFLPVMGIFIICLALISWYIPGAIQKNAEQEALEIAKRNVNQFKTIRKYYTQNVVSKVIGRDGIKGSVNHQNEENSIPLPATMIHDLAKLLGEQGTKLKLYSVFPFPNRQDRELDQFGAEAWQVLKSNPDEIYSRTEQMDAATIVRVGIADLMVSEACVSCHNSHPDTPKSDWRLNDVRGVLEIQMNIDEQLANGASISNTIITLILMLLILLSMVMAIIYRQSIGSRLNNIGAALREIASGEGDLTRRLDAKGHDEASLIAQGFNEFVDKLEGTIKEIKQAACTLSSTSGELSDITNSVNSAILQQDGQTEQIAAAITQFSVSAKQISGHAGSAAETTNKTNDITSEGKQIVTRSMQATDLLASDVRKAAEVLGRLQQDSDRITGVLDVIKGIAEQTNLLALNAAIEAARAGEQGRGFAVVADEVRTLAARTQESTTEIQEMTDRLRSATEEAVSVMGSNLTQADQSVSLSRDVQGSLEQISGSMSDINSMNAHVATAAREQNIVVDTIHNNINDIASLSAATAQGAEKTKTHVENLNKIVTKISSFTDQFKVRD